MEAVNSSETSRANRTAQHSIPEKSYHGGERFYCGISVVFNLRYGYSRGHAKTTLIRTKHRNRLNLEPVLILALTKIRPETSPTVLLTVKENTNNFIKYLII
jgi:hypothetical protein